MVDRMALPPGSPPLIQDVSDTAFLVAHARAVESARPKPLFSDPLAAKLAGEKGGAIAAVFPPMTAWSVTMRTLIIDRFLKQAWEDGVRLFLNLGAGLDTRPYRLELPPEVRWVEADYPHVLAYKEGVLAQEAPRCRLERRGLDLADDSQRRTFLAEVATGERLVVLTEGVVPYLDETEAGALAGDLRNVPGLVGWIVDYVSPESHRYRDRRVGRHLGRAQFKFRPSDWLGFFAGRGWKVRSLDYLVEEGLRVGRPPPFPWHLRLLMKLFGPVARHGQRGPFRGFAGYAWLEPAGGGASS